ncbi:uncharacterized protein LOC120849444 [Ixodes scapularis]|uniref:uncharacterized protein LOC120849444 n=1 Tax=Ixodes scapularis TaxID=6945 RepID=UPI001A9F25FF|nr:uncharacterized protein LOC120849444 [Ixodes scapularis]
MRYKKLTVCAAHFEDRFVITSTQYTDPRTGAVLQARLDRPRLSNNAVPTIFACSTSSLPQEPPLAEQPEKRPREPNEENDISFDQLIDQIQDINATPFWNCIQNDQGVTFLNINQDPNNAPQLKYSVTVKPDLTVSVYCYSTKTTKLSGDFWIPTTITSLKTLVDLLDNIRAFDKSATSSGTSKKKDAILGLILSLLDDLRNDNEVQDIADALAFLCQQVDVLLRKKPKYTPDFLIFASLIYTISPHAYKFMRGTSRIMLPHPSTIRRLCSNQQLNPSTEQDDEQLLSYIKKQSEHLEDHEKVATLMLDEVHLKPYIDYKGGNVQGSSANSCKAARTAHVFMIQSLLSSNKDVVHVLPVCQIDAQQLHCFVKKIILRLEALGFKIIAVVTDNNAINRKMMSQFATHAKFDMVYSHPADTDRPLFFIVDPVHLLKCIRNNWLSQGTPGKCFAFPSFESIETATPATSQQQASFDALRELQLHETDQLAKFGYGLSAKALHPSSLERQNVRLVLKIFNDHVVQALRTLGHDLGIQHVLETANFIELIVRWWKVANVKTPLKGQRLRDPMQEPVSSVADPKLKFLSDMVQWLDTWEAMDTDSGRLTNETHKALRLTCSTLVKVSIYCLRELGFSYVLLGKFQTDSLEARFGKYRRLAGTQYHISIRQLYESETKIRLQKMLPLVPATELLGRAQEQATHEEVTQEERNQFSITVDATDIAAKHDQMPAITYIAGYCAHAVLKKLGCDACEENLTLEERSIELDDASLIKGISRGGLKFPQAVVVNAVLHTQLVLEKLTDKENAAQFFAVRNQKGLLMSVTREMLTKYDDLDVCDFGHDPKVVMTHILSVSANTFLANYCRNQNEAIQDAAASKKNVRKLQVLSQSK